MRWAALSLDEIVGFADAVVAITVAIAVASTASIDATIIIIIGTDMIETRQTDKIFTSIWVSLLRLLLFVAQSLLQ